MAEGNSISRPLETFSALFDYRGGFFSFIGVRSAGELAFGCTAATFYSLSKFGKQQQM
jgi:hypothetical protein